MTNHNTIYTFTRATFFIAFLFIWWNTSAEMRAKPNNDSPPSNKFSKLISPSTVAQDTMVNPIDKEQEDCINKNPTDANMISCTQKAYLAWDKELNKNYSELSNELSPTGRQLLKTSQLEWLRYRDKELKLIDHLYKNIDGMMYKVMCVQDRVNLVKDRALELNEYLGLNYTK